ncbi:MAG: ScpA family protein [Betaproteobacteria bacterium]|jgi:segregation and condensation protein A
METEGESTPDGAVAVARVYGRPFREVPSDLYIPPDALEVFLDSFEGPLDLLLYLIRRHNLDVLDIPMAELTRQYLVYVDAMRERYLELAAEYLLMAAVLIDIKSRMLLPRPPSMQDQDGDGADPRAELVRRLLEYEQMKLAGQRLAAMPLIGREFFKIEVAAEKSLEVRLPGVSPDDLRQAWLGLLVRAKTSRHHRVSREQLSVREHMTRLLRLLAGRPYAEFNELFEPARGIPELVVTFLAVLELAKECLVSVSQQAAFAPIYLRLRDGNAFD